MQRAYFNVNATDGAGCYGCGARRHHTIPTSASRD
jgi:hypothetical protein